MARSRDDDVVVAFRGSETQFFDEVGAFKDWVLTDFRSGRSLNFMDHNWPPYLAALKGVTAAAIA